MRAAATAGGLLFGKKHAARGRTFSRSGHSRGVGRSDSVEVVQLRIKDGAPKKRSKDLRKQEIGNRLELISRSGMTSDIDTEAAQLLNQTPDFRTIGGNFLRDFRSADNESGVLHQQAHDAAQTKIGGLFVKRRSECPRQPTASDWCRPRNVGIMRESLKNNNRQRKLRAPRLRRLVS